MNCTNCTCHYRFTGENCDIDTLLDVEGNFALLIVLQSVVYCGILLQIVYSSIGIYAKIINAKADYKSVTFIAVYMMLLSLGIEAVVMLDPWAMYSMNFDVFYRIGFWMSFVLCINTTVLVVVVWFDVVRSVKKMNVSELEVPRIICIVMSVAGVVMIFIACLIGLLTNMTWTPVVLSFYVIPIGIALVTIIFIYIPKIRKLSKSMPASPLQKKLMRNTKFIFITTIFIISCLIISIPLNVNDALMNTHDPRYLAIELGFQIPLRVSIHGAMFMNALLLFDWLPIAIRGHSTSQTNISKLTKSKSKNTTTE